jgi:carboxyl-terminal processing protease
MIRKKTKLFGLLILTILASVPGEGSGAKTRSTPNWISPDYSELDLLGQVYGLILSQSVEVPDQRKLIRGAISGMLASLDPHSSYMDPKEMKEFNVETGGKFGGIGLEMTMEKGVVKVIAPLDDTPAAHAGILPNDLITHINGEEAAGITLDEATEKMRGKINTPVTLTILRRGREEPFDVKLTRNVIRIKPVKANAEGDIGYVRISSFTDQTQSEIDFAMTKLGRELGPNLKGWIIDLRNNPGGLVDQAISVSNTFLKRGEIVSLRGRDARVVRHFYAKPGKWKDDKTVVVLINGGSASASEIVAGALQDQRRAILVGTRSFGKGSVQSLIPFGNRGAVMLTTARYYTSSGRSIQAKGIVPDVVVEEDPPANSSLLQRNDKGEAGLRGHLKSDNGEEQGSSSSYVPEEKVNDRQLQAAIALLHGKQVSLPARQVSR